MVSWSENGWSVEVKGKHEVTAQSWVHLEWLILRDVQVVAA
jgi:hypothetical protein